MRPQLQHVFEKPPRGAISAVANLIFPSLLTKHLYKRRGKRPPLAKSLQAMIDLYSRSLPIQIQKARMILQCGIYGDTTGSDELHGVNFGTIMIVLADVVPWADRVIEHLRLNAGEGQALQARENTEGEAFGDLHRIVCRVTSLER